jgi:SAM-dependent methyltransferase
VSNLLVRVFGWKATLHHGDPLVWDRWRWIAKRLRETHDGDRLLDVGCGTGAFTIGTAKLGYNSLGLSWDARNQKVAEQRATIAGARSARFEICDVRELDQKLDLVGRFDVVLCTENIEHVIDDFRLMRAIAGCLKPGGRLLLTSPYIRRKPWSHMDYGPFPVFEDGRHVRRGYSKVMLAELCADAGLMIEEIGFVSGPVSIFGAYILERVQTVSWVMGWLAILPLRPFPPLVDWWLGPLTGTTPFCITLEAMKPRLPKTAAAVAVSRHSEAAA